MSAARKWKVVGLLAFMALTFVLFLFLFKQAGGVAPWQDGYEVRVVVPEPLNMVNNSDVRLGGVKVGRVTGTDSVGDQAEITFEVDEEFTPLYRNATVRPRIKTLVGETYLEITRGTKNAPPVPDGGELGLEQTREVAPLDRLLSTFDPATRRDVSRNLRSLGGGLDGRGEDLNRLFAASSPTVADGGALMQILRGQRAQLARAVDDTATVMQAFADRTEQVRTLAIQAKVTAETATASDASLRQTLRELPPTLRQAQTSLDLLGGFSARATPVVADLRLATEELAPTLVDLEPTARDARRLFARLPDFAADADPLVASLPDLAAKLGPAAGSLDTLLRQANPALSYLRPYRDDLGAFFPDAGAANNFTDATGHLARVQPILGPSSFDDRSSKEVADFFNALAALNPGVRAPAQFENAYPMPGTVGAPDEEQNFERVKALP